MKSRLDRIGPTPTAPKRGKDSRGQLDRGRTCTRPPFSHWNLQSNIGLKLGGAADEAPGLAPLDPIMATGASRQFRFAQHLCFAKLSYVLGCTSLNPCAF